MKMEDPESAPGGAENQAGAGGKGGEDGDEDGELDVSALLQKSQLSTYPDRVEGALEHLLQGTLRRCYAVLFVLMFVLLVCGA